MDPFPPDTSNAQCAAVSKLLSQGYISDTVVRRNQRPLTNRWRGVVGLSLSFLLVPPTSYYLLGIDRYFKHSHDWTCSCISTSLRITPIASPSVVLRTGHSLPPLSHSAPPSWSQCGIPMGAGAREKPEAVSSLSPLLELLQYQMLYGTTAAMERWSDVTCPPRESRLRMPIVVLP